MKIIINAIQLKHLLELSKCVFHYTDYVNCTRGTTGKFKGHVYCYFKNISTLSDCPASEYTFRL